jgi:rod shape-determining protein MreB
MSGKKDVLHVGIDLGTSRSAITVSNGGHHVVESYVGWPLDMVARKVVKKTILFGAEALENRPMLDLHRPLERGLIKQGSAKDEEAVHELLKHLISLAGKKDGQSVHAVVGVPAEALRVSRQHLRGAVKGIADALLIVSEPFAVAYGMDALLHTMVIDIGAGTTDFCVMNGHYPTEDDQRTLTNAGDSIDDQLLALVKTRHPDGRFSIHMVREWKEKQSFVGDPPGPVLVRFPVKGRPADVEITAEMKKACESVVGPIAETMLDLLSKVEPEYQEKVQRNIILAGGGSQMPGLAAALEKSLAELGGGRVRAVEDPVFAGSNGGLAIALDAPEGDWEPLSA